jgi:hypothetical protein
MPKIAELPLIDLIQHLIAPLLAILLPLLAILDLSGPALSQVLAGGSGRTCCRARCGGGSRASSLPQPSPRSTRSRARSHTDARSAAARAGRQPDARVANAGLADHLKRSVACRRQLACATAETAAARLQKVGRRSPAGEIPAINVTCAC